MDNTINTLYVDVNEIIRDWNVTKTKANSIIRSLNTRIKKEKPSAIIVTGKVNRLYYEDACLKHYFEGDKKNEPAE